MFGLVTQRAIREQAEKAFGPQRESLGNIAGHASDAVQNDAVPRQGAMPHVGARVGYGPITEAIATHGVRRTQVYPAQATAPNPQPQASLTTTTTGQASASSISNNGGTAQVQHLDYRTSTGVVPTAVPVPAQPPFHTAPISGA
ncbi:hypothetical protein SAMN05216267_1015105 [Actinacidiphila rubida]|uniref:Uncharacterized protein n=2 Tax=Actinacidiphila rubida TaxID=310780 RepID=A0A1H8L8R3_9ACTN|nr:hypothetical protein SAMN05216267_1015105 [Actinacidiphila rubida]